MSEAFNTAWIGFGWAQDITIEGNQPGDNLTFTVHRVGAAGRSASWSGSPDADGTLRVRFDGAETATWAAGVMPTSLRIRRGEAAGVLADLPAVVVKVPAVPAGGIEPLVNDRGKPIGLRLTSSDGASLQVKLQAGLKGDKGNKGDTGDLTPELISARDQAVASATSSAADAQATAGDRAATANDRIQVRADQIEVADDRMRTAADRVATSADRAQTGQDRTAVVGLRGETETLRDSASGHRAAAQAAATASQANRDATAADRVQTGQDRTSATASAAAAADDASQTAADRVQTGQDRQAAADSATAAAKFDPALFVKRDGTQAMTGGLSFGSTVAASPNDLSKHLLLWSTTYGWSVTSSTLNHVANGAHAFYSGANRIFLMAGDGSVTIERGPLALFSGSAVRAGVNLGQRGTAPTGPANGDLWGLPTGLWGYFGGAARQFHDTVSLPAITQALAEAGADQSARSWSSERVGQSVAAQAPNSFRNKLLNTSHLINQRAYVSNSATTAAGQYTIDRWRVVVSGQRLVWATDAAGIPAFTAPAGGVEQIVEAVNIEAGTYTLSWAGTASATVNGTAVANGGQVTLNGQANATVRFINGTFREPQLERAIRKTAVERRPFDVEMNLCRRYFARQAIFGVASRRDQDANGIISGAFALLVPMRATPTYAAVINSGAAEGQNGQHLFPNAMSFDRPDPAGSLFRGGLPGGVGTIVGAPWTYLTTITADAEIS